METPAKRRVLVVGDRKQADWTLENALPLSQWLRRDLARKIEGLGLPVTTITPRATGQRITDTNAFDSGVISQL